MPWLLLLAGLAILLLMLILISALAMAGHQSDLERRAEILAALQRPTSADKDPANDAH